MRWTRCVWCVWRVWPRAIRAHPAAVRCNRQDALKPDRLAADAECRLLKPAIAPFILAKLSGSGWFSEPRRRRDGMKAARCFMEVAWWFQKETGKASQHRGSLAAICTVMSSRCCGVLVVVEERWQTCSNGKTEVRTRRSRGPTTAYHCWWGRWGPLTPPNWGRGSPPVRPPRAIMCLPPHHSIHGS